MIIKILEVKMVNYEDLLFNMVKVLAPSIVVFLVLALIFDYCYKMLFVNFR